MLNANTALVVAAIVGTVTAIGAIQEWLNGAPEGDGTKGEGRPPEPAPDKTKAAQPRSKGFSPSTFGQMNMSGSTIVPNSKPQTQTDQKPAHDSKVPADPKVVAQPNIVAKTRADDAASLDAQAKRLVELDNELLAVEEARRRTEKEEKEFMSKQQTHAQMMESQDQEAFRKSVAVQLKFDRNEKEENLRKADELVKRVEQGQPGNGPTIGQTDGQITAGEFGTDVLVGRLKDQRDKQASELEDLKALEDGIKKGTLSKKKIDQIANTNMVTGKPRVP